MVCYLDRLRALRAVVRGRLESAAPRALAVDAREHRFCRSTRTRNRDRCNAQRDASVQAERGSAGGDQQYVRKRTNLARRVLQSCTLMQASLPGSAARQKVQGKLQRASGM